MGQDGEHLYKVVTEQDTFHFNSADDFYKFMAEIDEQTPISIEKFED